MELCFGHRCCRQAEQLQGCEKCCNRSKEARYCNNDIVNLVFVRMNQADSAAAVHAFEFTFCSCVFSFSGDFISFIFHMHVRQLLKVEVDMLHICVAAHDFDLLWLRNDFVTMCAMAVHDY
jgi:hypothetical protein